MSTTLSCLMSIVTASPGQVSLDVPEDWLQGRSVFGGLQAAIALAAMRTLVAATPLRTLQATFIAPVPNGTVRCGARVLRSGKSATHVEARIEDAGSTSALFVGVFGEPRKSVVSVTPEQPVSSSVAPIELGYVPGLMPAFTQHFAARWLRGGLPFSGDTRREAVLEVDLVDDAKTSEAHVLAMADFIPPVALSHLTSPAPGSTLTWMLEMLSDRFASLPLDGWRIDAELFAARDGYTSQSVMVWGPDGEPVAISRQSMMVFEK